MATWCRAHVDFPFEDPSQQPLQHLAAHPGQASQWD